MLIDDSHARVQPPIIVQVHEWRKRALVYEKSLPHGLESGHDYCSGSLQAELQVRIGGYKLEQ